MEREDWLFVVGQGPLVAQVVEEELPRFFRAVITGDADGDGDLDFEPPQSLHVAILRADLDEGGGFEGPSAAACSEGEGSPILDNEPFFVFPSGSPAQDAALPERLRCAASHANQPAHQPDEARAEQPLEAALAALSPADSGIAGLDGRGDRENAGFLRRDAKLRIFFLMDGDDCSVNTTDSPELQLSRAECAQRHDALYPLDRYGEGLAALKEGRGDLRVSVVAGVPLDLATPVAWDPLLSALQFHVQPDGQLAPSCQREGERATPPRRMAQLLRLLDQRPDTALASICAPPAGMLAELFGSAEPMREVSLCVPRALPRDAQGLVNCVVTETLPAEGRLTRCDQRPGRQRLRVEQDAQGRRVEVCVPDQLPTSLTYQEAGWFYTDLLPYGCEGDDEGDEGHLVIYSAPPIPGAIAEIRCSWPAPECVAPPPLSHTSSLNPSPSLARPMR